MAGLRPVLFVLVLVACCGTARSVYSNQSVPSGNAMQERPVHIMAFGDSLTAGYGLENAFGYPVVLERQLRERGLAVRVTNAGVSGDTSAGGAARLEWALADTPDILILELGANDALQGLDPALMRDNLARIIRMCQQRGVQVLLAGMRAPGNLGVQYAEAFDAVFPALAREYGVPLYPFFLDGVALDRALNQADGMHPNAEGVRVIVSRLLPYVERLLKAR